MVALRLLVFGTVSFVFGATFAQDPSESSNTLGFCYEIYAGSQKIGYSLGVNKTDSVSRKKTIFTDINLGQNNLQEIQSAESDSFFSPLNSSYELAKNNIKISSVKTVFQKNETGLTAHSKMNAKSIKKDFENGLVLSSQMTDLLFHKKNISQIQPKEKLIFETFIESEAKKVQTQTKLDSKSDQIILSHDREGEHFETSHAIDGSLIKSTFKKNNLKTKPCPSSTTHLNSALSSKNFKNIFSIHDQEKIKKCCQHF